MQGQGNRHEEDEEEGEGRPLRRIVVVGRSGMEAVLAYQPSIEKQDDDDVEELKSPPPPGGRRVTWNEFLRFQGGDNFQDFHNKSRKRKRPTTTSTTTTSRNSCQVPPPQDNEQNQVQQQEQAPTETAARKNKVKVSWNHRFQQLQEFQHEHGHTRVPQRYEKDQAFANWVQGQRKLYTQHIRQGDTSIMKDSRFTALQQLGFQAQTQQPSKIRFKKRFAQLLAFQQVFHHLRIPKSYDDTVPGLYAWVKKIRSSPDKFLTDEQREQLSDIGFVWSTPTTTSTNTTKNENHKHGINDKNGHDRNYALNNKNNGTTQNSINHNSNGKKATTTPAKTKKSLGPKWLRRIQQLKQFYQIHGHYRVSQNYASDPSLGRWVQVQRRRFNLRKQKSDTSQLADHKFQALEELGFDVHNKSNNNVTKTANNNNNNNNNSEAPHDDDDDNHHHSDNSPTTAKDKKKKALSSEWLKRIQQLKEYHKIHGNYRVPKNYEPDPSLGQWVRSQRIVFTLRKRGDTTKMADHKFQALEQIGFDTHAICSSSNNHNNSPNNATSTKKSPHGHQNDNNGQHSPNKDNLNNEQKKKLSPEWQRRLQQLKEYQQIHGDYGIPKDYVLDPSLGKWVRSQRMKFTFRKRGDKTRMADHKFEALERIGFDALKGSQRENKKKSANNNDHTIKQGEAERKGHYSHQRQHQQSQKDSGVMGSRKNGAHDNMVDKNGSKTARSSRTNGFSEKRRSNHESESSRLAETVSALNSTAVDNWEWYFEQLKQYKAVNGHCTVRESVDLDLDFSNWIKRQRNLFTRRMRGEHDALDEDKYLALKELGFKPRTKHGMSKPAFQKRLAELVAFRDKFGHTRVPSNYSGAGLRKWVVYVREAFHRKQQGEESDITEDQIDQLNEIDFEWNVSASTVSKKMPPQPPAKTNDKDGNVNVSSAWLSRFQQLERFKKQHGHLRVPEKDQEDQAFADWVMIQRKLFARKARGHGATLSDDRFAALQKLGFAESLQTVTENQSQHKHNAENVCTQFASPTTNRSESNNRNKSTSGNNQQFAVSIIEEPVRQLQNGINVQDATPHESSTSRSNPNSASSAFNERISQLKDFFGVFGHAKVPKTYELAPGLRDWLLAVRDNYKRREEGDTSALDDRELAALNLLDFDWLGRKGKFASKKNDDCPSKYREDSAVPLNNPSFDGFTTVSKRDVSWHGRLQQLQEYKATHGNLKVPVIYEEDQAFSNWVRTQKKLFTKRVRGCLDALSDERYNALVDVGFEPSACSPPPAGGGMNQM